MRLWLKAIIGLVTGIIFGIFFPGITYYIKPVGDIFLQFIKMLVIPLAASTVIVGVTSIHDSKRLGRVGIKAISLYVVSAGFAIAVGLTVGKFLFQQGDPAVLGEISVATPVESRPALEPILSVIPNNIVEAMNKNSILQVIMFALLLGIGLSFGGKKTQPAVRFFEALAEGLYQLTAILMELGIFCSFALIAYTTSTYGAAILVPLGKVLGGVYAASLFHCIVILLGSVWLFGRFNGFRFFKAISPAFFHALGSANAITTFPIKLKCLRKNLGIQSKISKFIVPFGTTINMDGTALYQGVAIFFITHSYGMDISTGQYTTIVVTSTLASIGMASYPGAGLIVLVMVLSALGLPLDGIMYIAGIDRVLDMIRTGTNVVGDSAISYMVAKSEGAVENSYQ